MSKKMLMKYDIRTFLLREVLILIVSAILLVFAAFYISDTISYSMFWESNYEEKIEKQMDLLKKEEFSRFSLGRFMSQDFFSVVDHTGKVVYTSNNSQKQVVYKTEELSYIPNIYDDTYLATDTTFDRDNRELTTLTQYVRDGEDTYSLNGIIVLDGDYNIVYTTLNLKQTHFTKQEINYWAENAIDGYIANKYPFTTDSNHKYYLIIHRKELTNKDYSNVNKIPYYTLIVFFMIFLIIVYNVVRHIQLQLLKPLNMLEKGFVSVSKGETVNLDYEGAEEYKHIFQSFLSMQKQLSESEKKRIKSEQEKQDMITDISHDLKTPVSIILGYVKAIQSGLISDQEKEKYLTNIVQKCETISELTTVLNNYNELEHPQFTLNLVKEDICEAVRAYLAGRYDELSSLYHLNLDISIPEESIDWYFDKFQLIRVFENIISNTIKYGKEADTIYFSLEKVKYSIIIRIGDNGKPIEKDLRKHIFDPFRSGDRARGQGHGTGLGMSIAKKIVELHNGTIVLLDEGVEDMTNLYKITLKDAS